MTNINCSANCIHQIDGMCHLENLPSLPITLDTDCAYFYDKNKNTHSSNN